MSLIEHIVAIFDNFPEITTEIIAARCDPFISNRSGARINIPTLTLLLYCSIFNEVIKEITSIVDGPISGEVKATTVDAESMIKEGREIAAIHPNMVVKIPMTVEGLKACKVLSAEGIKAWNFAIPASVRGCFTICSMTP